MIEPQDFGHGRVHRANATKGAEANPGGERIVDLVRMPTNGVVVNMGTGTGEFAAPMQGTDRFLNVQVRMVGFRVVTLQMLRVSRGKGDFDRNRICRRDPIFIHAVIPVRQRIVDHAVRGIGKVLVSLETGRGIFAVKRQGLDRLSNALMTTVVFPVAILQMLQVT